MKTESELKAERFTLGLILLALAAALLKVVPPRLDGGGALAMGIVLLSSAIFQRRHGWRVGWPTWCAGGAAAAIGIANLSAGVLPHSATPVAVLLIGIWLIGRGMGLDP